MGIYDRQYYREDERRSLWGSRSVVTNLIILNVAVWLAELLIGQVVIDYLALPSDWYHRPWAIWQFLTYGFLHDEHHILHIGFNMFGLWLFGRDIEGIYGPKEFLRIYLSTIVVAGLAWLVTINASRPGSAVPLLGASGGVMGIMILYVLHYPRRIFLIWGIVPMPAWAMGGLYVLLDIVGATNPDSPVANVAHLAGAAFALVYYRSGWNLGCALPRRFGASLVKLRPSLRVHDPDGDHQQLDKQVDAILEKISREGESSLTKRERRILEDASRRFQRRRH